MIRRGRGGGRNTKKKVLTSRTERLRCKEKKSSGGRKRKIKEARNKKGAGEEA